MALLNKSFYGSRYGFLDGQKRVKNREMSKMWLKIKDKLIHLFNKAISSYQKNGLSKQNFNWGRVKRDDTQA